jgi:diguanylate cyclase (GGDEF)-like protein
MKDIDVITKKVYKAEFDDLERFLKVSRERNLSREDLLQEYDYLLERYRSLLVDAAKLTKIGDINQKKLYVSHSNLELESASHYRSSITDPLTQLHNRGYLIDFLERQMAESLRYRKPLSCILGDVDNFKNINDTYGHLAGDAVLRKVAAILKTSVRESDVVGRYGGEEFLVALPSTRAEEAYVVAEKVRAQLAGADVDDLAEGLSLSISLGVSDTSILAPKTAGELLHNVDQALYCAKRQGKNRTVLFSAGIAQGLPES